MSRIQAKFADLKRAGRGGFIPFITAGDPDLATTELLLIELAATGADIIELGIPFSDPVADGEVIQRASERALRNGVTLSDALDCVARVRRHIDKPIVLFSYFNPLLQFGEDRFADAAKAAGIDGVLVTDLTPEEAESWIEQLYRNELDPIFLVAPTTSDERLARIGQQARGFIYAVSRAGVTGARDRLTDDAETLVRRIRASSDLPVAVGFGISTSEHVKEVWRFADAAVIGSAIVGQIAKLNGAPDLARRVGDFVRSLLHPDEPHLTALNHSGSGTEALTLR
jgi:tryptophan synthase alpha chain